MVALKFIPWLMVYFSTQLHQASMELGLVLYPLARGARGDLDILLLSIVLNVWNPDKSLFCQQTQSLKIYPFATPLQLEWLNCIYGVRHIPAVRRVL
jgi:hypothetical protein